MIIKIPTLPSVVLLLPIFLCSFTNSLVILSLSAIIYAFGLLFTKNQLKTIVLLPSMCFLVILATVSFVSKEENGYFALLRWVIMIFGTLFYYFQIGNSGILNLLKKLRVPFKLQIAFWAAIRSLELLLPTLEKGFILLRNENIALFSLPIRYISSLIVLLVNTSDSLICEMEMALTMRKSDYFSLNYETAIWNKSGIVLITLNSVVTVLMILNSFAAFLGNLPM